MLSKHGFLAAYDVIGIGPVSSFEWGLRARPGEEENAARIRCEKQKRVSALADCVILALRVIGATNEAAYARFFRSGRRLSP